MNLTCQYPKRPPAYCTEPIDLQLLRFEVPRDDCGVGSPESSGHSSAAGGSPLPSPSTSSSIPPSDALPGLASRARPNSPLRSQAAQRLGPAEFELLKHYLEHTSRDVTVDDNDQYTLQIGIPNLACESKPLMRSVLALAAVCKCCDIIGQPSASRQDRASVVELLSLAHQYHMESLHEIQTTLHEPKHYDHVLANAAMMGMYGSASHRARIWLVKTATLGDQPPSHVMPKYSQWIRLFRAAHLAYSGLLNGPLSANGMEPPGPARSPGDPPQYEYKVSPRVEQPRGPPNHVLSPILAATVGPALATLEKKARGVLAIVEGHHGPISNNPDLQVCFAALDLFNRIATSTFAADDSRPSTPGHGPLVFDVEIEPVGRLSQVSPWLRKYTANITSMVPSPLPRRFIMAFIHKAPARYLSLVDEMIDLIQTEPVAPSSGGGSGDGDDDDDEMIITPDFPESTTTAPEPSIAHQLAVDIFAHWLVLVIMLDNVWWIGGIGAWELGRIVAYRREGWWWHNCLWSRDEDWWPESMFEVSRQLDKYRAER
ncbi:hypothetical protein MMYC01_210178 [Madurella mycetomatis]|uniref:Sterol uptake control protein 2 n=1 Tax=Madurella mycetomatis TaxID=100816 RepID=A0A175VR87_9PEZI|nr:hypothetical protein MMYC01_210178 [Madurella mycetomatis]